MKHEQRRAVYRRRDFSPKRLRQCTRKTAYRTERVALKAAADLGEQAGKQLRVYHCPVCKEWHLTSKAFRPTIAPTSDFPSG